MLFIIDLAGVVDSDFQGIQINFAPPPAPQDLPIFAGRGGAALFPRGGAHIPDVYTIQKHILTIF